MKIRTLGALAACLGLLLGSTAALADQPAGNMEIVRDAIRAEKKLLIASNMELTESDAGKFWPVYETYQADLTKLNERELNLIKSYAENYETLSDEVAKKLLDDFLAVDAERLQLQQSFLPKFQAVVSAKKVARYYQLESKIDAVVSYELAARIPLVK